MGLTYTSVTVESLSASGKSIDARFLVDSGAVDCLLPAALLRAAGVEPDATDIYELADGRTLRATARQGEDSQQPRNRRGIGRRSTCRSRSATRQ